MLASAATALISSTLFISVLLAVLALRFRLYVTPHATRPTSGIDGAPSGS